MQQAIIDVRDMSCGRCVAHVTEALIGIPGVEVGRVAVSSAEVRYDPARTTPDAIANAIGAAGYPAKARATERTDRLACHTEPGRGGGCCCG